MVKPFFRGLLEKWRWGIKMAKMVTDGRSSMHLQKASQLSNQWGPPHMHIVGMLFGPWMREIKFLIFLLFLMPLISPALFARDWYVRPAGGNYGAENGTSYANAWDGLPNVVWGTGGVQPGDTLYICGLHIKSCPLGTGSSDIGVTSGTSDSARVILRGDYPSDPGIIWGGKKPTDSWTSEGNNVWSVIIDYDLSDDWIFEDVTANSWTVLDREVTLAGCQGNPGSYYSADFAAGSKLYVHCSDDGNPTGRIVFNRWGYVWLLGGKQFITLLNLKFYCPYWHIGEFVNSSHIKIQGCTVWYGDTYAIIALHEGNDYFEIIDCDIAWASNGAYIIGDDNTCHDVIVRGCTIHDIGVRYGQQNSDAHAIGAQGGYNNIFEDNFIYNCGVSICLYAYRYQTLKDTIIRRNFVKDSHQLGGNPGYGISLQCDNTSLSDKSGNQIYQNIVKNCTVGIRVQFEDEVQVYNNVVYNCGNSFESSRTYENYGPNIWARNNISLSPKEYHVVFSTGGTIFACNYDFNLYYPDTGTKFYYKGTHNFSGWKTASSCDPHSLIPADPLFIAPASNDFQLQSSSPAIDAGISVGLSQDRQGTPIPQGFAPDIGAYECRKTIFAKLSASPISGGPPLTVNFSAEATGDFPPFAYNWDLGDGQSSSSQYCSHTYIQAGTYVSTLTVTDPRGNKERTSITIQAYRPYRLSLSTNTGSPAPGAGGTTNPPPGDHSYAEGSTVQLSAVPYINYRFSQWWGDIAVTDTFRQNTAVVMDREKAASANFCVKCGDVNGDLAITPADAQAAFDIFLGRIANPTAS